MGIGFVALLTGAIAQRLLSADTAQIEQTETEIVEQEQTIATEFREIARRLADLEHRVEQRERHAGASPEAAAPGGD